MGLCQKSCIANKLDSQTNQKELASLGILWCTSLISISSTHQEAATQALEGYMHHSQRKKKMYILLQLL